MRSPSHLRSTITPSCAGPAAPAAPAVALVRPLRGSAAGAGSTGATSGATSAALPSNRLLLRTVPSGTPPAARTDTLSVGGHPLAMASTGRMRRTPGFGTHPFRSCTPPSVHQPAIALLLYCSIEVPRGEPEYTWESCRYLIDELEPGDGGYRHHAHDRELVHRLPVRGRHLLDRVHHDVPHLGKEGRQLLVESGRVGGMSIPALRSGAAARPSAASARACATPASPASSRSRRRASRTCTTCSCSPATARCSPPG